MEIKKLGYFVIQSSVSGDPDGNDWVNVLPEDVPDWVKAPDVMSKLNDGEMACADAEKSLPWFRAIRMPITTEIARYLVTQYFEDKKSELQGNSDNIAVKAWVSNLLDGFNEVWIHRLSSGTYFSSELAADTANRLRLLLEQAKADPVAYDAALELAAVLIDRGQTLPSLLSQWLAAHLRKQHVRPRKDGKSKYQNRERDLHIAFAVLMLEENGITATRNDEAREGTPPCGCDIVSEVLTTKFNIRRLSYDGVKKIWGRFAKLN